MTVEPREIAALLRDLPSIRDGFESDEAREAWLERKRDLLARIEAEIGAVEACAGDSPHGVNVGEVPIEIAADLESWGGDDEFEVNDRLGPIDGQEGVKSDGDA